MRFPCLRAGLIFLGPALLDFAPESVEFTGCLTETISEKFNRRVFQLCFRQTFRQLRFVEGGEDARWVQTHSLGQVHQHLKLILLIRRHRPDVKSRPLLDGLRRIKSHLLQRVLNSPVVEHWRERLRELDCSRTRLRLARELGLHLAMPFQEEGLTLLGQLRESGFVFSAPVLGDLIALRRRCARQLDRVRGPGSRKLLASGLDQQGIA